MSISSVSNNANLLQSPQISGAFKQRKQDFAALGSALQSGDLARAQKAFAALQQDTQAMGQARGGQGNDSTVKQTSQPSQSSTPAMKDLMDQLKQALGSGDMQGAQQAFAAVQQKMQASQSQGHRHHHHGGEGQASSSNTTSAGSATTSAQATSISTTA